MSKNKAQLRAGDMLFNRRANEHMVVFAADDENVWLKGVEKSDKLKLIDGEVWVRITKTTWKNRCTQRYAQTVFEYEGAINGEN